MKSTVHVLSVDINDTAVIRVNVEIEGQTYEAARSAVQLPLGADGLVDTQKLAEIGARLASNFVRRVARLPRTQIRAQRRERR